MLPSIIEQVNFTMGSKFNLVYSCGNFKRYTLPLFKHFNCEFLGINTALPPISSKFFPFHFISTSPLADIDLVGLCPANVARPYTEDSLVAVFMFNSVIESSIKNKIN